MQRKRVILITSDSYGIKSFYQDLIDIEGFEIKIYRNLFHAFLKNFNFNGEIIVQTKSSILPLLLPRKSYILILHGFIGLNDYTLINVLVKNLIILIVSKKCKVWSNSLITANINLIMLGLESDRILYPAKIQPMEINIQNRDIYFLFAGRNTRSKNISLSRTVVDSYNTLCATDHRLTVISNSIPNDEIQKVEYLGQMKRNDLMELLIRTKVFISLNPLEPYGIVYEEALSRGCYVVTPRNTGFAERYSNHERVILVNNLNPNDIAQKIAERVI